MDNLTLQKIKDIIEKNETIGIAVGRNPSIDEMAASLALYLSLRGIDKKVSIASPQEPIVELSSLVSINKVKTVLQGEGGDLIVSFPYREGEIEKVSYTIENNHLNIVVKAGENGLSFSEREVKYKRGGSLPTLLFIIGTPRLSDLGTLFNPTALKDTTVINIDNKADNQGFGDVVLVSPKFSSVSEQLANLLNYLGLEIDIDIAQNLLSGISFATDNFQKPNTSYLAFEMASLLLKKGATRTKQSRPDNQRVDNQRSGFLPGGFNDPFSQPVSRNSGANFPPTPPAQPQQPSQQPKEEPKREENKSKNPPSDWLVPKVYKGSTEL